MRHLLVKLGHLFGAAGLLNGMFFLMLPLAVVTVIRVKRGDPRVARTWTGWRIMGRTAFLLLASLGSGGRRALEDGS